MVAAQSVPARGHRRRRARLLEAGAHHGRPTTSSSSPPAPSGRCWPTRSSTSCSIPTNAQQNFEYVGYQPALTEARRARRPDRRRARAPDTCLSTLVTRRRTSTDGLPARRAVASTSSKLWTDAYSRDQGRLSTVAAVAERRASARRRRRGLWASFTLPGTVWLIVALPRAVLRHRGDRLRRRRPDLRLRRPPVEPAAVELHRRSTTSSTRSSTARCATCSCARSCYVALALALCFVIGYPVAYYLARHAGRTKGILLACSSCRSG